MSNVPRKILHAWVVAADMGYGHQRAVWPLRSIAARGRVLSANSYPGMPRSDFLLWQGTQSFYEALSRFKKFPIVGEFVFNMLNSLQKIEESDPRPFGSTRPSFQLRQTYWLMNMRAWGKHLIEKLSKRPIPLITSFAPVALMAEYWKYPGAIALIVTDSDISRAWAPLNAQTTRILYCAPTKRAAERLQSYGVPAKNIKTTGFPLPEELLGKRMKDALQRRIFLLDPSRNHQGRFQKKPITISFAIGGAGAQDEIALSAIKSLRELLRQGRVRFRIILGTHEKLLSRFPKTEGVSLDSFPDKEAYFQSFPKILEETDILWTKPSELVFYAALGIPLILSPPIGSQEQQNRTYVLDAGAGVDQMNPKLCHQWLPDLIASSRLAKAAMQGYKNMEKHGTRNIKRFVQSVASNHQEIKKRSQFSFHVVE